MIIYPNKLERSKIIGITAPSDSANLETIDYSIENIKNMGYDVIETSNVRKSQGLVSSDGRKRADEFIKLWKDSNIGYIVSARGGEFLMEMIPFLDVYEDIIRTSLPKWVQGYSDTSLLLYYLTTKYNISTIHFENLGGYSKKNNYLDDGIKNPIELVEKIDDLFVYEQESFDKYEINEFDDVKDRVKYGYNLTEKVKYEYINGVGNVKFTGRMLGGCIDVISQIFGTKYDFTLKYINSIDEGILWYFDNCELTSMELYRRLWKMKEMGYFKNANGFLFGRTRATEYEFFTFKEAILRALEDLNVPIVLDVDIGHVSPQWIIINGGIGEFKYVDGKGILTQRFVK